MIPAIAAWGGGAWNWLCQSPIAKAVAWGLGLLVAAKVAEKLIKAEGAREQQRIHNEATARERVEMVTAKTENANELRERVDRAADAVSRQPMLASRSELRRLNPALAAVILGPDPGDGS